MKSTELQTIKQRYNIVGNCDALNHVLDVALQVAPTDLSVLIFGESGVGKEIIPRVIHDNSPRRRERYFAINCGSIPEGTIDSELFGHVKGSYTGAVNDSPGYFGIANKGTLFLDEVGELPLATQARLLRVLETGEYIPVGGTEILKTDVRIVAATNVNIRNAISEGRFREDLYYRLNSIPVQMPPLRERGEDVVLLFRLFAMQMAEKYKMDRVVLTDEAKQLLMRYKWPGNVRQLKNITEQISVLSKERVITPEILAKFIPQDRESTQLATIPREGGSDHSFENEREILYKILFELRGNVNDMRREMSALKKQLDDVQAGGSINTATKIPAPLSPIAPVSSLEQGKRILEKLIRYEENKYGSWRNRLCFLADDENAKYVDSIVISGHTDSTGSDETNRVLSTDRANAVLGYLMEMDGGKLDKYASYFCAAGYGKTRPVESNNTKEGRAANRRIEISIILRDDTVMDIVDSYLEINLPELPEMPASSGEQPEAGKQSKTE